MGEYLLIFEMLLTMNSYSNLYRQQQGDTHYP